MESHFERSLHLISISSKKLYICSGRRVVSQSDPFHSLFVLDTGGSSFLSEEELVRNFGQTRESRAFERAGRDYTKGRVLMGSGTVFERESGLFKLRARERKKAAHKGENERRERVPHTTTL